MSKPPAIKTKSPFPDADARKATREAKREAVLLAAVGMFNEFGFHATSLDDVATSLGVSKPTIYHYLGNKDQVLLECVSIGLAQLQQAAEEARTRPGRGIDRLRFFLERYAQVNMDHFGRCVIRTGEELLSPESAARFRAKKREIDDALRTLIEEGIADHSVAAADSRLLAFTLAGALNWPARWFDPGGSLTPEQAARGMVEILLNGFAPRDS